MANSPTQILNTNSNPAPQPTQPNRGITGRAWDRVTSAVNSGVSRIGDGLGSGAVTGAKREVEQLFKPGGSFITELENAFLRQPSQEIYHLKALIEKALQTPTDLTVEDIQSIYSHLQSLLNEEDKLLKVLKPDISPEQTQLFKNIFVLFEEIATDEEERDPDSLALYYGRIVNAYKEDLQNFDALFGAILKENQGTLIKLLSFFQQRLLAIINDESEKGLNKSLERGADKVIEKALALLNTKLHTEGGIIDRLDIRINDEEKGILGHAAGFLQKKMMALVDQVDDRLTKEAHPILSNVRRKFSELRRALAAKRKEAIQKSSKELEQQLEQLFTYEALAFHKKPLADEDRVLLVQLKAQLPGFYSETPPDQNSMLIAAESGLATIDRYYENYEGTAAKIGTVIQDKIDESAENLQNKLDPVLTRIENIPKKMISNVLGTSFDPEKGGDISDFLGLGSSVLTKILNKGAEAVSKQALSSFTKTLTFIIQLAFDEMDDSAAFALPKAALMKVTEILEKTSSENWSALKKAIQLALDKMGDSPALKQQKEALKAVEEALEKTSPENWSTLKDTIVLAMEKMDNSPDSTQPKEAMMAVIKALEKTSPGNWSTLKKAITAALEALKPVKIYINGFRIPKFDGVEKGRNAEEAYFENLNELRDAINEAPAENTNQDWQKLAEEEQNKLIGNVTKFLTMKHIYEATCGLKSPDELFYTKLLTDSKAKGLEASDEELKNLFFKKLKDENVNVITRIWAHIEYFFYGQIVKQNVANASDIFFKKVFNYIKQHTAEHFNSLRHEVTTNFTRYLSILGGAYRTIAQNPQSTGLIEDMIKSELEKKEANLGFNSEELYLKFSEIVINETLGTGLFGWLGKKFIKNPEEIVRSIIDKSTDSIRNAQGYTHALNTVILEQLEEIWRLLRAEVSQQKSPESTKADTKELSELKKSELSALVKNLFEILGKSKCQTVDELRKLLKDELSLAKINKMIDGIFIEDVIEKVTNLLAVCVQSLAEEKQLQKLTYRFASLVNRTFEIGQEVTLKQMQDEERRIAELSNQILRFAINSAVEDKFDFTGTKQQKETNGIVDELHSRFQKFYTFSDPHPEAKNKARIPGMKEVLREFAEMDNQEFNSDEGINKINHIVAATEAFEQQCYHSSFQSKGSAVNSDNKNEIAKRYLGIAEQTKPLVKAVAQLKQHSNSLKNTMTVVPYLNEIIKCAQEIQTPLFNPEGPSNEELAFCENQLTTLSTQLEGIKQLRNHATLAGKITAEHRILQTLLIDVRKAAQTSRFYTAQSQSFSLLEQIASEKKKSLGPISKNPALKAKLDQFRQEVAGSFEEAWLPQLLEKLQTIEDAAFAEQVDNAAQEFLGLCRDAATLATATIRGMQEKYTRSVQRLVEAVDATHLLDSDHDERARNGIRKSITLAQTELEKLKKWEEENILQVPYINFKPDLPFMEMKQLQDWASGFVYNRVTEKLEGFMHFLKREETYRYGLLHHLFLLPYVQKVEGKKRKVPSPSS